MDKLQQITQLLPWVAAITAYNFPFFLNVQKLFPALVTGNTVILKPSIYTPFAALIVAEAAAEVGFPPGVLSVITGGRALGEMIPSSSSSQGRKSQPTAATDPHIQLPVIK